MPTDSNGMTTRKRRHIDVCLDDRVTYSGVTTGLERYRLPYNALTQTSLAHIDLSTSFLGVPLRAPILVGAMTGGAELSGTINKNLAGAAQRLGIGMMLGSQRIMLGSALGEQAASSFTVRDVAPDVLLFGNIGLAQLTTAAVDDISNALKRVGADALAVHTNPLQEAVQRDGDGDFSGSLDRLRQVAAALEYPVLLKEVGHGIGTAAIAELTGQSGELPVAAIDVAGAGGTSWSRVEQLVRYGEVRFPDLADWGIPTAQAIVEVRQALPVSRWWPLVASAPAWTRQKHWHWAPTSWPSPAHCWLRRSNPLRPWWIGCSALSTSCESACMVPVLRTYWPCATSASARSSKALIDNIFRRAAEGLLS